MNTPPSTMSPPVLTTTLVIPGRNCAGTLRRCLDSVVPLLVLEELQEIIFVDDGSTDATRTIAAEYPVRILTTAGNGPGAARNAGWQAATTDLIWFIDSDCVAEADALKLLKAQFDDPGIAGCGGSYSNLYLESLLATLIHEEIVARHRRMPREVDFLGSFNVLYRRDALEQLNGFDEALRMAEDCDLSFRAQLDGWRVRFTQESRVGHHHPRSFVRYLRSQLYHGYWRAHLYAKHKGKLQGDNYSQLGDHLLPLLSLAIVAWLPWLWWSPSHWFAGAALAAAIIFCAAPMSIQLMRHSAVVAAAYVPWSVLRGVVRAIGLSFGVLSCLNRLVKTARGVGPLATPVRQTTDMVVPRWTTKGTP